MECTLPIGRSQGVGQEHDVKTPQHQLKGSIREHGAQHIKAFVRTMAQYGAQCTQEDPSIHVVVHSTSTHDIGVDLMIHVLNMCT